MLISVIVKTNKSQETVLKLSEYEYAVSVKEKPIDGRANLRIVGLLAKHFEVTKAKVILKSGYKSRIKIIEILGT